MRNRQLEISQRDWDESIMKDSQPDPRYGIYNCINCLDYGDNDGEPCQVCNLEKEN